MLAVGPNIKIVIVGDESVGKTEFINKFCNAEVPISRSSTVFQSIQSLVEVSGVKVPIQIWDTTGKKQYEIMLKSIYENANIVLVLFSVADNLTYQNAIQKWYKKVNMVNQKALKILVGNKTDIRDHGVTISAVKERDAKLKIEQELRCKYLQCSAVTGQGVKHVFQYSVRNHMGYADISERQQRKVNDSVCCKVM